MATADVIKVFDKLPQVGRNLPAEVDRRVRQQGFVTEADMKTNIQQDGLIDTGAMLGSTAARQTGPFEVEVGPSAESADGHPYPVDQEFGNSRNVPAHWFARRAAEKARGEFPERFDDIAGAIL